MRGPNSIISLLIWATLMLSGFAAAQGNGGNESPVPEHSFRSCSLITSELITAVQFHQQGLTLELLKETLPAESPKAFDRIAQIYRLVEKDGALEAYRNLNQLYLQCAQRVYELRGMPPRYTTEFGFYYCSGENKLRHQALVAFAERQKLELLLAKFPEPRHQVARDLYQLAEKQGLLGAYENSASQLKQCLNEVLDLPQ